MLRAGPGLTPRSALCPWRESGSMRCERWTFLTEGISRGEKIGLLENGSFREKAGHEAFVLGAGIVTTASRAAFQTHCSVGRAREGNSQSTDGWAGQRPGCWESLHKTSSPAPAFGDFCRALAASFVKLEVYMTASGPRSSPRFQILWFYLLKKYYFLSFTLIEILNGGKKKCMAMFWAPQGEWCKQNHTRVQLPSSDIRGATHSESSSCGVSPALQQESDEDFSIAIFLVSCP